MRIRANMVRVALVLCVMVGCTSTMPKTIYLPKLGPSVFGYFAKGQPIAAVKSDGAFVLTALEPIVIGRTYMRLWVMYRNDSEVPYLMEPGGFVRMTTTRLADKQSKSCQPTRPSKILAQISDEAAIAMISQTIGGALQAASVQPTTATTHGSVTSGGQSASFDSTTVVNDQSAKVARVSDQTSASLAATATWYDAYKRSVDQGVLRRHTIFPGQSVNGYIYFTLPDGILHPNDRSRFDPSVFLASKEYAQAIEFNLPGGAQTVTFTPIPGE